MSKVLEFYFDYGSPNAYIAHVRLPEILARTGANVEHKPMLLGGVFQLTGNQSPAQNQLKLPNMRRDMARYIGRHKVPFQFNKHFPVNTLKMMRGAVAAQEDGIFERYNEIAYNAMWREGLNMSDEAVFIAAMNAGGLDGAKVLARGNDEGVKAKLKAATEAAAARGVFGAPTFFVRDEMFFGQDRLDFVEDALMGKSYL
jgi:2-hydroxychromene-2-carboxylate isomerase